MFLTNNTALPALTIAALYKSLWQVELFFKWIKQHLRIKRFIATSENAVRSHIWWQVARTSNLKNKHERSLLSGGQAGGPVINPEEQQ